MKRNFRLLIPLIILMQLLYGQGGGYAGTFLQLSSGARCFGMGNVSIATADDATTGFANPGLVGMLYDAQFNATLARLPFDRNYYDMALVYPLGPWGNFSLGWSQLSVDNIKGRDQFGYITQKFSDLQSAFVFGYGKLIGERLSIGFTGKYLYHSLAGYSAGGMAVDIGSAVYLGEKVTLGGVFRNVNSALKWDTDSGLNETLLRQIGLGVNYYEPFNVANLAVAADAYITEGAFSGIHLGAEYLFRDMIIARSGFSPRGLTYGGGIMLGGFRLDLAVTPENFGDSNRIFISLNWLFGGFGPPAPAPAEATEMPPEQPEVIAPPTAPEPSQERQIVIITAGPLADERAEVVRDDPANNTITVRLLAVPGADPITLSRDHVRFIE